MRRLPDRLYFSLYESYPLFPANTLSVNCSAITFSSFPFPVANFPGLWVKSIQIIQYPHFERRSEGAL